MAEQEKILAPSNVVPDSVHPDYSHLLPWWLEGWDFYRGGLHVLEPQQYTADVFFYPASVTQASGEATDSTSPQRPQRAQLGDYQARQKASYLWSHEREQDNHYKDRHRRLSHFAIFGPTVDAHSDAVMRVSPSREEDGRRSATDAWWQGIFNNCDGIGTHWNSYMRDSLAWGIVQGRAHTLVDMDPLAIPDGTELSVADEEDMGLRPYLRHLTTMDIIDWSLDKNGYTRWLTYQEPVPESRPPGAVYEQLPMQYVSWTPHVKYTWTREALNDGRGGYRWVQTTFEHELGFVPVSKLNAERIPGFSWRNQGIFPYLQRGDRVLLNLISLYHDLLYGQTFSTIWLPDRDGMGLGEVVLGRHNALTGPDRPEYVSADTAQAGILLESIQNHSQWMYQMASGRGEFSASKEARSQSVLSEESEQKRVLMAKLAESMEEYEKETMVMVQAWGKRPNKPAVSYARNFDLKTLRSKLSEAGQYKGLEPGPEAMSEAKVLLGRQLLRELGADPEKQAEVRKQVEDHTQKLIEMRENIEPSGEPSSTVQPDDGADIRDGDISVD